MRRKGIDMDAVTSTNWAAFIPVLINILSGIGIFIIGWILSRWAYATILKRLGNDKGLRASETFRPLIATVVKYAILLGAIYAGLTQAGVAASSLLAVFGAAGLAIALAVQGTLSNIAAGVMLIFLRSMKVGEYIETPDIAGTVLEVGLFTTHIKRPDGVFVTVPNAKIWGSQIANYSRFKTRRVDVDLELSRDNDLAAAVDIVRNTIDGLDIIASKESTNVSISGFSPTTATLKARCWLGTKNLGDDGSTLRMTLHEALRAKGVKFPKSRNQA